MDYPLYNYLEQLSESKVLEVNPSDLASSINSIKNLPQEDADKHYEEINSIIYFFDLKTRGAPAWTNKGKSANIYSSTLLSGGKGMIYNINNFPIKLQAILHNYCQVFGAQ